MPAGYSDKSEGDGEFRKADSAGDDDYPDLLLRSVPSNSRANLEAIV